LRPRAAAWGYQLVEARGGADLLRTLRSAHVPLVVVDVGRHAAAMLEALADAVSFADEPLILVLDPERTPGLGPAAFELGAAEVYIGPVAPPRVVSCLDRWRRVADERRAEPGWRGEPEPAANDTDEWIRGAIAEFRERPPKPAARPKRANPSDLPPESLEPSECPNRISD
jgi:DNA-binding NtrC family response regulator